MPRRHMCTALHFIILFAYVSSATAALVNRTIDDEYGDSETGEKLTYYPPDASSWKQGSNCTECLIHLDASQAWRGTWHDCTQHTDDPEVRSITARFTGTAVYVYNALAAYEYHYSSIWSVTYLTFEIDGQSVGEFFSDEHLDTKYNVPVLAHEGLPYGAHTLVIRTPPGRTGQDWTSTLFDYIQYTTDDAVVQSNRTDVLPSCSTPSEASLSPTDRRHAGMIAGGTVGGVAMLAICGILLLLRRKVWSRVHRRRLDTLTAVAGTASPAATPPEWNSGAEARIRALEQELVRLRTWHERPPNYEEDPPVPSYHAYEV